MKLNKKDWAWKWIFAKTFEEKLTFGTISTCLFFALSGLYSSIAYFTQSDSMYSLCYYWFSFLLSIVQSLTICKIKHLFQVWILIWRKIDLNASLNEHKTEINPRESKISCFEIRNRDTDHGRRDSDIRVSFNCLEKRSIKNQ